jgi:DNA-directed RNA polymerase specialized sigma24 family protein
VTYDETSEATGQTRTWVNRHLDEGKTALRRKLTGAG